MRGLARPATRRPEVLQSKYQALHPHGPPLSLRIVCVQLRTMAAMQVFRVAWPEYCKRIHPFPANLLWSIEATHGVSARAFRQMWHVLAGRLDEDEQTVLASLLFRYPTCDNAAVVVFHILVDACQRLPRHLQQSVFLLESDTHRWCEIGQGAEAVVHDYWVAFPQPHLRDEGFFSQRPPVRVACRWNPGDEVDVSWRDFKRAAVSVPSELQRLAPSRPVADWRADFVASWVAGDTASMWNRFESILTSTERAAQGRPPNERVVYRCTETLSQLNGDRVDAQRLRQVLKAESRRERAGFPFRQLAAHLRGMPIDDWMNAVCLHGRQGHAQMAGLLVCGESTRHFDPAHRKHRLAIALRDIAAHVNGSDEEIFATLQALTAAMGAPDCADIFGWTAFMHACSAGNLVAAQALQALGAADGRVARNGRTALHLAVAADQVDVVRWLLQLPGLPDRDGRRCDLQGHTPLQLAYRRGNRALVALLRGIG